MNRIHEDGKHENWHFWCLEKIYWKRKKEDSFISRVSTYTWKILVQIRKKANHFYRRPLTKDISYITLPVTWCWQRRANMLTRIPLLSQITSCEKQKETLLTWYILRIHIILQININIAKVCTQFWVLMFICCKYKLLVTSYVQCRICTA